MLEDNIHVYVFCMFYCLFERLKSSPFFIFIIECDCCMQQRWLNKGLCHASAPSNVAGMWDSSHGDLTEFLKKVQESGASIESATVFHATPPVGVQC